MLSLLYYTLITIVCTYRYVISTVLYTDHNCLHLPVCYLHCIIHQSQLFALTGMLSPLYYKLITIVCTYRYATPLYYILITIVCTYRYDISTVLYTDHNCLHLPVCYLHCIIHQSQLFALTSMLSPLYYTPITIVCTYRYAISTVLYTGHYCLHLPV